MAFPYEELENFQFPQKMVFEVSTAYFYFGGNVKMNGRTFLLEEQTGMDNEPAIPRRFLYNHQTFEYVQHEDLMNKNKPYNHLFQRIIGV